MWVITHIRKKKIMRRSEGFVISISKTAISNHNCKLEFNLTSYLAKILKQNHMVSVDPEQILMNHAIECNIINMVVYFGVSAKMFDFVTH